jgi:hypothetical protein
MSEQQAIDVINLFRQRAVRKHLSRQRTVVTDLSHHRVVLMVILPNTQPPTLLLGRGAHRNETLKLAQGFIGLRRASQLNPKTSARFHWPNHKPIIMKPEGSTGLRRPQQNF